MLLYTRQSDHVSFWDKNYPAVLLKDTLNFHNPHYHQPTDSLDKVNLPFVAEVWRALQSG